MFRNLVVECSDGTWVRHNQSDNKVDQALTEDTPNRLKDVVCNVEPEDLILDEAELHRSGVVFLCAKQDTDHFVFTETRVVVRGNNYCTLLCNYHHVLSIKPVLQDDGVARWWVVRHGGDIQGEEVVGKHGPGRSNIYCW